MFAMDRRKSLQPAQRSGLAGLQRRFHDRGVWFARETRLPGTAIFATAPLLLEEECCEDVGSDVGKAVRTLHTNGSFTFRMSFGPFPKPAVMALGKGASMAGCWSELRAKAVSPVAPGIRQ